MRYRLGIDAGTASMGLVAVSLDAQNQPEQVVWHQDRIFAEPLDSGPAGLKSKKAARREARMQRRQLDRRGVRTRKIAVLGHLIGVDPLQKSPDSGASLPEIRALAARQKIELSDFLRVMIKISKRRGYQGEFRPKKEGAKLGEVESGNSELNKAMQTLAAQRGLDSITLGEYLYQRNQNGLPVKLKLHEVTPKDNNETPNLYALRKQLIAEFEHIWTEQSRHHKVLNGPHDGKSMKDIFSDAVFYQRPLKSPAGLAGQCPLEPTLARAPRAHMAFQYFRIEKVLCDLRWGAGKRAQDLSKQQKDVIRSLLDAKETVSFKAIYSGLEAAGCPKPESLGLNLERLSRDELNGNKTLHIFRKLGLIEQWKELDGYTQIQVINFLADIGSPEQLDDPEWHTRFSKKDGSQKMLPLAMVSFINKLKENGKLDRLTKMGFDGGRAGYSLKALQTITDWLAEPWWPENWKGIKRIDEEAAIRVCYPKAQSIEIKIHNQLAASKSTGNSVVDGALRQLHYGINQMISALGTTPAEIVVEMAREMGVGITKRNERESDMNKNRRARLDAGKAITGANVKITPARIRRYLLWKQQGEMHCPYCTKPINLNDALSGEETEFEHIIPRTLTQVGLKNSEIVLAHRSCNQEKGNRTPWQVWGEGRNSARWTIIEQRANEFQKNRQFRKAKLLLLRDFELEVLTDESIEGFADRQFHQTSWIAKEAAQWLQSICPSPVSVSRGELTARLRRHWHLETVIPQVRAEEGLPILDEEGKVVEAAEFERLRPLWEGHPSSKELNTDRRLDKRIDHRHHLIDALTIALTSRSLFQRMARKYKEESEKSPNERPKIKMVEPPLPNIRYAALAMIREPNLYIKPDRYPDGAIFQDTAYGKALVEGEDKSRLTLKVALTSLVDPKNGTLDQARKAIANIVSEQIRSIVSRAFEQRIVSGKTPAAALAEPIYQSIYGKRLPIKKVVCFTSNYADDAVVIEHTSRSGVVHRKLVRHAGYAYLEIVFENGKLLPPSLVPIQRALKLKNRALRNGVSRLHKGDVVEDAKDNRRYRVGYFKAEGVVALIPYTDPRAFDAIKEQGSGKKKISFGQITRLKLI